MQPCMIYALRNCNVVHCQEKHAVFGNKFGWERPTFFAPSKEAQAAEPSYSWGHVFANPVISIKEV
jgi:hypothetical protein